MCVFQFKKKYKQTGFLFLFFSRTTCWFLQASVLGTSYSINSDFWRSNTRVSLYNQGGLPSTVPLPCYTRGLLQNYKVINAFIKTRRIFYTLLRLGGRGDYRQNIAWSPNLCLLKEIRGSGEDKKKINKSYFKKCWNTPVKRLIKIFSSRKL